MIRSRPQIPVGIQILAEHSHGVPWPIQPGQETAQPRLYFWLSYTLRVTWMSLFYSLSCSVNRKPLPVFGLNLRPLVLSMGEGTKYIGGPLLPVPFSLVRWHWFMHPAWGMRKHAPPLHPMLSSPNKLGDLGQVFEPLGVVSILMCKNGENNISGSNPAGLF